MSSTRLEHNAQQACFGVGFLSSFIFLYLYTFTLIESKYSIFLHLQPFRSTRSLTIPEEILFVLIFSLELFGLLMGIAWLLWRLYLKFGSGGRWLTTLLIPVSVVFLYFVLVTAQFQVLRYFKDGIDHLIVRQLGGGDIWSALSYAADELAQLLPLIIAAALAVGVILFLLLRFGSRAIDLFQKTGWVKAMMRPKMIVMINLTLVIMALIVSYHLPVLNKNLGYSLAHRVYEYPWRFLTDLDADGYGLVPPPVDHAPLDAARHPYALEIVENGIDENGVGGDLVRNIWQKTPRNWVNEGLERRNVLLLVLESARSDLIQARYRNQWVMPTLRSLPGKELKMIAHTAFSAPAIISIFNGAHSPAEPGTTLIARFKELGYRTGVFSGQNEGFGRQDNATGMKLADSFFDSRSAPPNKRMHLSSSAIASAVPAGEVLSRVTGWLREDDTRPFFAYINLQELHFPYSHRFTENLLIDKPIPRYAIHEKQSDWLNATYYNAARGIDNAIGELVRFLKASGLFEDTVILILGDHGEELFDSGSLGHGTNISFEQNTTLGKLINSTWFPEEASPVGLSEVPILLHNALSREPEDLIPLRASVLCFLGVRKPLQVGLFTRDGLVKYDFRKNAWTHQAEFGARDAPTRPDEHLIHLWESYVLSLNRQGR